MISQVCVRLTSCSWKAKTFIALDEFLWRCLYKKLSSTSNIIEWVVKLIFSFKNSTDSKTVLDAAANGAFAALPLIAGITANLVAFVSMVAFLNGIIGWLAMLVGHEYVSFEWIFGKLFTPLAYIIGIRWDDCEKVGAVIATKTIVNEFVAFERLGKLAEHNLISVCWVCNIIILNYFI